MNVMKRFIRVILISFFVIFHTACTSNSDPRLTQPYSTTFEILQPKSTTTPLITVSTPNITSTLSNTPDYEATESNKILRFAVIGDYGMGNDAEKDVAALIVSMNPDLVITTGDNNYPNGAAETLDQNIGQYFHQFLSPYNGAYGIGAIGNQFYPSLGNHDWITDQAQPYLDYFNLPGNERYYQFTRGLVGFFVLDSDAHEPDGVNSSSIQAEWLKQQLSASSAKWNIIYFHHPPYSSGLHGSTKWMRWPFKEWGADLILSGHDHTYERLLIDGLTYIINGLGGASIYDFNQQLAGSMVRYNQDYGAMLIEAGPENLKLQFITRSGILIDEAILTKNP